MINLKDFTKDNDYFVLSDVTEFSKAIAGKLTKDVELTNGNTLIAVCYKASVTALSLFNAGTSVDYHVTPVVIKSGKSKDVIMQIPIIQKAIIEQGQHVYIDHKFNKNNIMAELSKSIGNKSSIIDPNEFNPYRINETSNDSNDVLIIEFKVIPTVAIQGYIPINAEYIDVELQ